MPHIPSTPVCGARAQGSEAESQGGLIATMKHILGAFLRTALFLLTIPFWLWLPSQSFSSTVDLLIIVGGILLVFLIVWLGRVLLDQKPTIGRVGWVTIGVHFALMVLLGAAIIRAVVARHGWPDWLLPIPVEIGWLLVVITSLAALLTVINLAVTGLGAPFAVALTRKLTADWMYAWTRNPMVLATLAFLLSLGIWLRSALFVLWVLVLVTPAWLAFVKVYEERELEIRFGAAYREYKSRTPMLFPRRPQQRGPKATP